MQQSKFMEKYPIYTMELDKKEISQTSTEEILEYFKNKIDAHPVATMISIFDNYNHTLDIGGEIAAEILDVKNIVFCFGTTIPNTQITAVRPRSIGICELKEKFSINFLEVPREELNNLLQSWTKDLIKK